VLEKNEIHICHRMSLEVKKTWYEYERGEGSQS
jgi:hypothetical protein